MLARIRTTVQSVASVAIEGAVLLASGSATAVAVVFGKALLAVALGAFAFGAFLRLTARRRRAVPAEQQMPAWLSPAIALATVVECAALVEALDLPVRLSQPGFQYYHWLFVVLFLMLAYGGQARVARRLLLKREVRR